MSAPFKVSFSQDGSSLLGIIRDLRGWSFVTFEAGLATLRELKRVPNQPPNLSKLCRNNCPPPPPIALETTGHWKVLGANIKYFQAVAGQYSHYKLVPKLAG